MRVRPEPQSSAARPEGTASGARNNKKSGADNQDNSTTTRGTDFASILDAVSAPPDERSAPRDKREDMHDARRSTGRSEAEAERISKSSQDELRETEKRSAGQGGGQRPHKTYAKTKDQHGMDNAAEQAASAGQRPVAAPATEALQETEIPGARAIITDADLSSIVSTIRTDITNAGRREVTIELSHSVLEGLRIKIGSDAFGRLRAEFIATSEQVKAQLDHRAYDLTDLLRARGINLSMLKTTLERDNSGGASQGDNQRGRARGEPAPAAVERKRRSSSSTVDGEDAESDSNSEGLKIYRA
jgi:hypothetical protein